MKNNWPRKKLGEVEAVRKFLNNNNLRFDESKLEVEPKEPSDIEYDGKDYQIVSADFEFRRLINTTPKDSNGVIFVEGRVRNPNDIWIDFIINPLRKKGKYGKSAEGIILLITSHSEPPWVEKKINLAKNLDSNMHELQKLCFDEIYLVCPTKNIRVYP